MRRGSRPIKSSMIYVTSTQTFASTSPLYDRGRARVLFLNVAKQKKPQRRKIKAAIRCQLDYLQRNLKAIDALIASGAVLSSLKTYWWRELLVISERQGQ